jgi:hypothetical protein
MITLPDFKKAFEFENNFYLSCDVARISKMIAHYELYKMVINLPGSIVECGVFKGASLTRFAMFRELFESPYSKKVIGFDTFHEFPETEFQDDKNVRESLINTAGGESISIEQLTDVLQRKDIFKNIELIEGDITSTVPEYIFSHPELKVSLLNLDVDIYEPSVTILEHLYSRIVKGGVLVLDDYGTFPGETKAVDDFFKDQKISIRKFPYCTTPSYIIKD